MTSRGIRLSLPARAPVLIPVLAAAFGVGLVASPAGAAFYYVNSSQASAGASVTTVAQAQYRVSQGAWDQGLSAGAVASGSVITANLGNNSGLSDRVYDFTLAFTAGQGFVFSMSSGGSTSTVSWGTFASAPAGSNAPTLGGVAPTGAGFNGLALEARATRSGSASMTFSNLAFSSSSVQLAHGAFEAGAVTKQSGGPNDGAGYWRQTVLADADLSQVSWTFTGRVSGAVNGAAESADELAFTVSMNSYAGASFSGSTSPYTVPTPAAGWSLAMGAAFVLVPRRSRASLGR